MRIFDGTQYRDATPKELAEHEKKEKEIEEMMANMPPTAEQQIAELQSQNDMLTQCILEMSEIVYK